MCPKFKAVIPNCCFESILNLSDSFPIQQVSKRKLQLLAWQENLLVLSSPVFSKWRLSSPYLLSFLLYVRPVFRSFYTQGIKTNCFQLLFLYILKFFYTFYWCSLVFTDDCSGGSDSFNGGQQVQFTWLHVQCTCVIFVWFLNMEWVSTCTVEGSWEAQSFFDLRVDVR